MLATVVFARQHQAGAQESIVLILFLFCIFNFALYHRTTRLD